MEYFGEHPAAPCGNCGSCNNVYEQADLTAAAKWMINCVAETRGRFGKAIVFGTLQGANRARLKEIGATNYKSYGQLKDLPRDVLDRLLAQLLEDGYLVQTDDQYAVLRMGDITPLKQPGAQVLVKLPPRQEPERVQRPKKRSVMDALTKAGLELYHQLRTLRFEIAQREGLPPYVVFGDKSLADMCLRAPATVEGMIGIYGMGERKYEKYADQFFAVIDAYRADHPDAVLSLDAPDPKPAPETPAKTAKPGSKATKAVFCLTEERAAAFAYQDALSPAEMKEALAAVAAPDMKAPTIKDMEGWLLDERLIAMEKLPTKGFYYVPTPAGVDAGLRSEDRVSARGTPYSVLQFTPPAQKLIVEHYIKNKLYIVQIAKKAHTDAKSVCAFWSFMPLFPQQEQDEQQHCQPRQVDPGNQQGCFHGTQHGPELFLGGPVRGLLPWAVVGRFWGRGARLAAVGAQHRRRADITHIGDGAAIVLKIVVLPHLSYRWQTT